MPKNAHKGFTVIELIVVLTIIALLTFFIYYYYQDLSKRARDAVRLADMANMQQAITIALHDTQEKISYALCSSNNTPCQGTSFPLTMETQKTDGSGWLKIDFDQEKSANFNSLPIDPRNDDLFHYNYFSDGLLWKLTSTLESEMYKNKMETDGGTDPHLYEITVKVDRPKTRRGAI